MSQFFRVFMCSVAVMVCLGIAFFANSGEVVVLSPGTPPPGERFVGMEECRSCHAEIVEHWESTAHAHAWETLTTDGSHQKPECVRCHSTGFGLAGGMDPHTLEPASRRQVQCESCHGPAERHLQEVMLGAVSTYSCQLCESGKVCITCHTPTQDPDFEHKKAWKRVMHPKVKPTSSASPSTTPSSTPPPEKKK